MEMYLYNDLTGKRELFEPSEPGHVTFYVCGPTVYDLFHVGNARPFILFDVLRRYFESQGLRVTYVQNFTDIDDKMIKRAHEMEITVLELAEKYIAEYFVDADALGIHRATHHPRATHEIPAIISMIEKLVDAGHAYASEDGVYFEVSTFDEYGKLSKQSIDDLHSGARVEVAEHKRSPLDFALWKFEKPGEPAWDSPWGRGRPGWHIECSAMAERYLERDTIDIHGGGSDLLFPHHENEVAQSECAHGAPFARFWIHNGYLMIDREKMSKSLGNFFTVREVRAKYAPIVIRLFMLSAHYRSPINYSQETLEQASHASERLKNGWSAIEFALASGPSSGAVRNDAARESLSKAEATFDECMQDDFNTAGAIGAVFEAISASNTIIRSGDSMDHEALEMVRAFLERADAVLGIIPREERGSEDRWIDDLIEERKSARANKDFKRSDEIRDELAAKGIILEDTPQGTRWKRKQILSGS